MECVPDGIIRRQIPRNETRHGPGSLDFRFSRPRKLIRRQSALQNGPRGARRRIPPGEPGGSAGQAAENPYLAAICENVSQLRFARHLQTDAAARVVGNDKNTKKRIFLVMDTPSRGRHSFCSPIVRASGSQSQLVSVDDGGHSRSGPVQTDAR